MIWIEKNWKLLMIICLLSAILASAEVVLAKIYLTEPIIVQNRQAGIFLIPFIVASLSFLPLMYLNWFEEQKAGTLVSFQKMFFWFFAFSLGTIFILIVYYIIV